MKIINLNIWTILLVEIFSYVHSYKILGIFTVPIEEHFLTSNAILNGLVQRGHEVNVISVSSQSKFQNYTTIVDLSDDVPYKVHNLDIKRIMEIRDKGVDSFIWDFGNDICDLLDTKKMRDFISDIGRMHYDLVLVEVLSANCFMGFGHLLKVPVIALSIMLEVPWIHDYTVNSNRLTVFPIYFNDWIGKMNFWGRVKNVILNYYYIMKFNLYTKDIQTNLMRKYLSADMPNIREIEKNISMVIVNDHHVLHGLRAVTPAVIHAGGIHLHELKSTKLTTKLQRWMDESVDGVVLFSFGMTCRIETIPKEIMTVIFKSFSRLSPIRFLIKVNNENEIPVPSPSNVLLSREILHAAVLRHNNTLAFINHGGYLEIQEAIYYYIPIIGIPFILDQPRNVAEMVERNMAVQLKFEDITENSLNQALNMVLNNPIYRQSIKRHSTLLRLNLMDPLRKTIYWIEYVLRHGPTILRSPGLHYPWWQIALLDIYALLSLCAITIALITFSIMMLIYKEYHIFNLSHFQNRIVKAKKKQV